MKTTKRALAVLLAAIMMISMVCVVPTVNAEITSTDIVASFSFENGLAEDNNKVTLTNNADGKVTIIDSTDDARGQVAEYDAPEPKTGLKWSTADFDPFGELTGTDASISMWVNLAEEGNYELFSFFQQNNKGNPAVMFEYKNSELNIMTAAVNFNNNKKSIAYVKKDNDVKVPALPAKEWVLVTYVQENTTGIIYINGENVASGVCDPLQACGGATVGDYSIGCHGAGIWSNVSVNGLIDDFTIYNRALTAAEVAKLYDPSAVADQKAIDAVVAMLEALETPAATEEYLDTYHHAKEAYEKLTDLEKADESLADAVAKLDAAYKGYFNAVADANGGKLASFTFEGASVDEQMTEESGLVKLTNAAGEKVTLDGVGEAGEDDTAAKYNKPDTYTGLYWQTAEYNPFAKLTGENASVSMWVNLAGLPEVDANNDGKLDNIEFFNFFEAPNKNSVGNAATSGALMIEYCLETRMLQVVNSHTNGNFNDITNTTKKVIGAPYTFTLNEWTLITYVQEGTTATLYVNGMKLATGDGTPLKDCVAANAAAGYYAIGCHKIDDATWVANTSVNGMIDDFAIYNKALTADEIMEMAGDAAVDNLDFEVTNGAQTGADITWNTALTVKGMELGAFNQAAKFKDYGVYYGVSEAAVDAAAATGADVSENGKLRATSMSFVPEEDQGDEDVNVYTVFGFRLKGVPEGAERHVKFYVTYEINGVTYTEFSDGTTALAR